MKTGKLDHLSGTCQKRSFGLPRRGSRVQIPFPAPYQASLDPPRSIARPRGSRRVNSRRISTLPPVNYSLEPATGGFEGGVPPSRGDATRSERARGRGPLAGAGEASLSAAPATERGSNPRSRSIPHF